MVWQAWPSLQPLVGAFNKERVQVGLNIEFRNFADTFSFKVLQNKFLRDCCKDARRDCKLFRPKYVEQEN